MSFLTPSYREISASLRAFAPVAMTIGPVSGTTGVFSWSLAVEHGPLLSSKNTELFSQTTRVQIHFCHLCSRTYFPGQVMQLCCVLICLFITQGQSNNVTSFHFSENNSNTCKIHRIPYNIQLYHFNRDVVYYLCRQVDNCSFINTRNACPEK